MNVHHFKRHSPSNRPDADAVGLVVLVCGAAIIWVQGVSRVWYVTVSSLHRLLITAVLPFFSLVGKRPSEGTRPQAVEMHDLMPALPRRQLHPVVHVVDLCQDEVGASPFGVKLGAKTTFDSGRRQQDPIPDAERAACYPPVVEVSGPPAGGFWPGGELLLASPSDGVQIQPSPVVGQEFCQTWRQLGAWRLGRTSCRMVCTSWIRARCYGRPSSRGGDVGPSLAACHPRSWTAYSARYDWSARSYRCPRGDMEMSESSRCQGACKLPWKGKTRSCAPGPSAGALVLRSARRTRRPISSPRWQLPGLGSDRPLSIWRSSLLPPWCTCCQSRTRVEDQGCPVPHVPGGNQVARSPREHVQPS